MLTIAVSTRSLFNVEDGHKVWEAEGQAAFDAYMQGRKGVPLRPGTAFHLVRKLLGLNEGLEQPVVEVVVLSRNSASSGLRVMNSIRHHNLTIEKATFTRGGDRFRFASAMNVDLFLSTTPADASAALAHGIAAAVLLPQDAMAADGTAAVRFAFDGDSVIFSDEADKVYRANGIDAFRDSEESLAGIPLQPGPFKPLLDSIHDLKRLRPDLVQIALVTARGIPAHERAVQTLQAWGIDLDELIFCAGAPKGPLLKALGADIFFDDTRKHVDSATDNGVTAGHVPVGEGGLVAEPASTGLRCAA